MGNLLSLPSQTAKMFMGRERAKKGNCFPSKNKTAGD
jgi:hypothetical protein